MSPHVVVAFVLANRVPKVGPFQISIRSSSSARSVFTQRCVIGFMRGARTPVNTVAIPAPARISLINAGYLPSRSRMRNLSCARQSGTLQIHEQVADDLRHLSMGGVRGGAEDPYAPTGVVDGGEDVLPRPVRVTVSMKSIARIASAWERRKAVQATVARCGDGAMRLS